MLRRINTLCLSACLLFLTSCQTYYEKSLLFNHKFEQGDYEAARNYLSSEKKLQKNNSKVLYDLNYATASFFLDDTKSSIEYFASADQYISDFSKNYAFEALALISNPSVRPYEPEFYEAVMLHFYQALNYIKLNDMDEAIVECRRMNLELQKLSDNFRKHDGKRYSRDAFGHYLMGIIYEARKDYNNAFIAYRNALEIYRDDYNPMYGQPVPKALQYALVRSAYKTGLVAEGKKFEKELDIKYSSAASDNGRLVLFLLDGLSPVKTEKEIEFFRNSGIGYVNYVSSDGSMSIPIFLADMSSSERSALNDFKVMRLALPQYVNRTPDCTQSQLLINNKLYFPEAVEDIEQIAKQSLSDRHWSELGKSILRVATKEVARRLAAEKNEYVGLLVNLAGAISEKADTRSWMSLPGCIRLIDIEMPPGQYKVQYTACQTTFSVDILVEANRTAFSCFRAR